MPMRTSSFQQKLLNGEVTITREDLPSFLYDESDRFMPAKLFFNIL